MDRVLFFCIILYNVLNQGIIDKTYKFLKRPVYMDRIAYLEAMLSFWTRLVGIFFSVLKVSTGIIHDDYYEL